MTGRGWVKMIGVARGWTDDYTDLKIKVLERTYPNRMDLETKVTRDEFVEQAVISIEKWNVIAGMHARIIRKEMKELKA